MGYYHEILPKHIRHSKVSSSCNRWWLYSLRCSSCGAVLGPDDGVEEQITLRGVQFINEHAHGAKPIRTATIPVTVPVRVVLRSGVTVEEIQEELAEQSVLDVTEHVGWVSGILCAEVVEDK